MRKEAPRHVDADEMARQATCARAVTRRVQGQGFPASFAIVTYGCQMNAHDSEKLAGMLQQMGLTPAERDEADLVLYNTCCVRDNAQRRALGNVTWLKELKKKRPQMLIAVCGCMVQQPGMAEQIIRRYPFVNLAFGTHNLHHLPELLLRALSSDAQVVEVLTQEDAPIAEDVPLCRASPHHAYITVMYGCDNFCSYCIVPYVRGRERSRDPADILAEAQALRKDGVQEIMLLGQNVNSYGNDLANPAANFPALLRALDDVGIPRIRFMTSHPKDLSDDLMETMAAGRHICHALHLPVQSGSDAVLASMGRGYTRAAYLERVAALRARIPDICLTTDLIVAYPGESEEDFRDTLSLVAQVSYDAAYTFIYSPRDGTKAAQLPGRVDAATATARIEELIALQRGITAARNTRLVGTVQQVLVEEASRRDAAQVAGKTSGGLTVNFPGDAGLIGSIVPVRITSAAQITLRGVHADEKTRPIQIETGGEIR
ncbi:MAG: tRNA (N6-isopentenyl adenosine(37)-C2)-methylthiotransferase MiaB [Oscillospiraceae bacterium]|jgi:tRNA-2-methylthio-N6-dimethylallyladenosine synthase|nr:tRNA (N6-isopentenyl adenosine(37)-C2)-methylthiotransferase MiaB [Oscillospiraceae bacterium]